MAEDGAAVRPFGRRVRSWGRAARERLQSVPFGSTGFVAVVTALVLVVVAAAVLVGTPVTGSAVDLLTGRAWLTNSQEGVVMLANGSSARVDVRFEVDGTAGHELEVLQIGGESLLVDHTTGEVRGLDVAALEVGAPWTLGEPGAVDVVAAGDRLVVVRRAEGIVEVQDPLDGRVLAEEDVGSDLTRAVVDDEDRIWVADRTAGAAVPLRYARGDLAVGDSVRVGPDAAMSLALVDGAPVAVKAERRSLVRIVDDRPGEALGLPLEDEESPRIARVTEGAMASLAVNESGHLLVVEGERTERVSLGLADHDLGEPVVFERRIYVPDYSAGELVVLDDRGRPAGPGVQVGGGRAGHFSARVEGGRLWVDDPDSDDAFVLGRNDTSFRRVDKAAREVPSTDQGMPELVPPPPRRPPPLTAPDHPPGGRSQSTPTTRPDDPGTRTPSMPVDAPGTTPPTRPSGGDDGARRGGGQGPGGSTPTTRGPATTTEPDEVTAPGAPTAPTAVAGDRGAVVAWGVAPANGADVTEYVVRWTPDGGDGEPGSQRTSANELRAAVDGLRNGTAYEFTVEAVNRVGTGPPASAGVVTPDGDTPGAPSGVTVTGGADGTLAVSWDEADRNGTSPIASYTVVAIDAAGAATDVAAGVAGTSVSVGPGDGLALGGTYAFTVTAVNERGATSPPSEPSAARVLAAPAGAPGAAAATVADGTVTVTWAEAPLNGGMLAHYEVAGDNGAGTQTVAAPGATFGGLQNGVTYTFTVRAVTTANGETLAGDPATASGTPGRAPTLSGMTVTTSGNTVNWSVSFADNASGAATCQVISNGALLQSVPCTNPLAGSFAGNPSTDYAIYVQATNGYGVNNSEVASARTADPPAPPAVSVSKGAVYSNTSVCWDPSCRWVDVRVTNFPPGTVVTIQCREAAGAFGPSQTVTVDGSGAGMRSPCYFGYPGREVWAVANGVTSPRLRW